MRFNGTNEIEESNLMYNVGTVRNSKYHSWLWNGISDSCLPFIGSNQWYFQSQLLFNLANACFTLSRRYSTSVKKWSWASY